MLFGSDCFAQSDIWTLERCFRYAKENNIQLKQTEMSTEFAELDLDQSKANRLPSINGIANQRFNFGRSIDPTTNEFRSQTLPTTFFGLNASMDVFNGFSIQKNIKRSELALEDAKFQERIQENNLGLSIVSAYLEILRAQDQLTVLREQINITKQQKDRTEKLIKAGVLPKGDILNIESQIANENLNIVNAENVVSFSKLNLMQILEYYDTEIQVVVPDMETPSSEDLIKFSVEQVYTLAMKNLPEMQSADLKKQIADMDVDLANAQKYPSVSISGGAGSNFAGIKLPTSFEFVPTEVGRVEFEDTSFPIVIDQPVASGERKVIPFGTQMNENFSYNLGINVSVPIFNKYQIKNGIKRSEIARRNAQLTEKITQNQLYQTIQQAFQSARSAAMTYETNKKNIDALEQALQNIEKRYDLGLSTALEYATARNNLAIAKLNLNAAKYEYVFRLKILDFYQGKPLNFK